MIGNSDNLTGRAWRTLARWLAVPEHLACLVLGASFFLITSIIYYSEALITERSLGSFYLLAQEIRADFTREQVDYLLGGVAALVALGFVASLLFRPRGRRWDRAIFIALLVLAVFSASVAALKYMVIRDYYFDYGDTFSYYLGPKYFDELGYDDHYECAATAQLELGRWIPPRMRNLHNEKMQRSHRFLSEERQQRCRSLFSEDRWQAWVSDVDTFRDWHGRNGWKRRFRDHGYHGAPLWQLMAGWITNSIDLNHRNMVLQTFINLAVLFLMLGFVIVAFGWRFGLLFAIFFWTNFLEKYLLGGAFLRYNWLASLVIGISLLRLGRYAAAGALITLASMLKIFPVLLFAGLGFKIAYDLLRHHKLEPRYRSLLIGATVAALVLGLASVVHAHGLDNWVEFWNQMQLNYGRFATGRIGFIYNFLYPKEFHLSDPVFSYQDRFAAIQQPFLWILSVNHIRWALVALFVAAIAWRVQRMDDVEATAFAGFSLFLLGFGTVKYYYVGLVGLPLMWHATYDRIPGKLFLLYLFAASAAGYLLLQRVHYCFLHNTFYTAAFTLYIALVLIFIGKIKRIHE